MEQRRLFLRFAHIDYRRQRLIFDLYHAQRGAGPVLVIRQHQADAVADMARVAGEDRFVRKVVLPGEPFAAVVFIVRRVAECEHNDALHPLRFGNIDIFNNSVGLFAEQRHSDERVLRQRVREIVVRAAHLVRGILANDPFAYIFKIFISHPPHPFPFSS